MVTDIVGTTHLVVVSARFQEGPHLVACDECFGPLVEETTRNLSITDCLHALFKCCGLDEAEVRNRIKSMDWSNGKSKAEREWENLGGEEGDSPG
jgi:hypothetical protein